MPYFDNGVYETRRRALAEAVAAAGIGGVVLGTGAEFEYLTGSAMHSHERLTAFVAGPGGFRVVAPMTDVATLCHEAALDGVEVVGWRDGDNPYALVKSWVGDGVVELGASLTADHVFELQARVPTRALSPGVRSCFLVKDAGEVAELTRAGEAIDAVHARVPELLVPGATEIAVADQLRELIEAQHVRADFVIVGSGPNGANPHHDFSDRVLESGDPVVVDIGGTLDSGYHSDCTRTYVVRGVDGSDGADGEVDPEFLTAYEVLHRAQQAAVEAARPGMTAGELDAVARDIITQGGYGRFFTHRLGHGIGLAVHEAPFIIDGSDVVLEEGMVFSIEPGIYVPGRWGMRIEDIVQLGAAAAVPLNHQPREVAHG
ncbi:Xaa-Pro dipeptidase [Corynebacterium glaucum]|uniref:Xaa-Pro dipeptidase n=1 Tax=Corynebacterium glaucum TaxID=187491 RepID=A0A1Q2HWJ5_9CORY|nr:M24 family metallopeptidase [Corynebacterium glaucum]AQQ15231.1 Xaa-Pro dipeptidase [Corynebacterium glaucum]